MRTYAKNYKSHPQTVTRTTAHDYKNRESTEWDVRLDLIDGFKSSSILDRCVAFKDKFKFCFIGAEEIPDVAKAPSAGFQSMSKALSTEIHVHIAVVLEKPAKRGEVLELLRGPRSLGVGAEYAVPRNPKFTYAGWIAHHSKIEFKINPDGPLKLYEYGDLPMDSYDEETCWKVIRMIKKFGNEEMKQRFKSYSQKADEYKQQKALEEATTEESTPPTEAEFHEAYNVPSNPPVTGMVRIGRK